MARAMCNRSRAVALLGGREVIHKKHRRALFSPEYFESNCPQIELILDSKAPNLAWNFAERGDDVVAAELQLGGDTQQRVWIIRSDGRS